MIKTRFAPSPTGYLHVGSLRTALYSFLFARKNKGKFVLRIEDTDKKRKVPSSVENLYKMLDLFGLNYDEGPYLQEKKVKEKGCFGPYIQSERTKIYQDHADYLIKKEKAYFCFCDSKRLTEMRETQQKQGLAPKYDKFCLNLSKKEIEKKLAANLPRVVRLKVPMARKIMFDDLIRGQVEFNSNDLDDQILIKSDSFPTYHLANVVDDHLMEITHVIRAEEWLPSTPKHIMLYEAFGWNEPQFAHLPLVLNPDKTKLSKRRGSVAAEDFLKQGYLKEALLNFIAFLGWNPKDNREIFSLEELIQEFDLKNINKSGAVFNLEKLTWLNKQYLKKLSLDQFYALGKPFLSELQNEDENKLKAAFSLEKERISTLAEIEPKIKFIFALPQYDAKLLLWKKLSLDQVKNNLYLLAKQLENISEQDFTSKEIEEKIVKHIKDNNFKVGDMLWPFRVALSGQKNSPGPFEIATVLGKKETLARIKFACQI